MRLARDESAEEDERKHDADASNRDVANGEEVVLAAQCVRGLEEEFARAVKRVHTELVVYR